MIPTTSSIVLNKINYASLILATALANAGIKVIIIHSSSNLSEEVTLEFDAYDKAFLTSIGFDVSTPLSLTELFEQSKKMLTKHLCNILWETQIGKVNELDKEVIAWIKNGQRVIEHKTRHIIESEDLLIMDTSSTIKHIATYYWKLEGSFNNYINPLVLSSQAEEKRLISDFYTSRKSVADRIKGLLNKKEKGTLNIRESKLSLHLSQDRDIEAGDLLPNLIVYDEKKKSETSFYEWCKPGMFCMLMIGQLSQENLFNIAKWVQANFPIHLFYLPPTEKNQHIFEKFKIVEGEKKTLIIRPDQYIGLINDRIDLEIVDNYLTNFIRFETKGKPAKNKLLGQNSIENYP
ncbi:hypothetical protein EIM50_22200 [Pseudoxanthomonas sp. SGD-10]|nr:hypothetical protein EIM50_22200 [Pseudoxanthomonas sp. SGD-10]